MVWTLGDFFSKGLLVAAVSALAACQAADGTTVAPDTALVNNLMAGLGAVDPKAKGIEYKPRAPLAMPAEGGNLPEPETRTAGAGAENWPQQRDDAEINALQARFAESVNHDDNPARLRPDQMGGIEVVGVKRTELTPQQKAELEREMEQLDGARLTREELRAATLKGKAGNQDPVASQNAALERKYLTQPPMAYSTPSAEAPMPMADVKVKKKSTKVQLDHEISRIDPRCLEGDASYCN